MNAKVLIMLCVLGVQLIAFGSIQAGKFQTEEVNPISSETIIEARFEFSALNTRAMAPKSDVAN